MKRRSRIANSEWRINESVVFNPQSAIRNPQSGG